MPDEIDNSLTTRQQNSVLAQCAAVSILDGFDAQLVAIIAPILIAEWALSGTEMGQLLTAGLVGLTLGTLFLGPISDKIGRRPQLLCCVMFFALCTIATAMSGSMTEMFIWRLLTGLGLGGAVVSCYALASEFASPARFGFSVSVVKAGFPIGAAVGAMVSPILISTGGWQLVSLVAGVLPLLLWPLLYFRLPESPSFLACRGAETSSFNRRKSGNTQNSTTDSSIIKRPALLKLFSPNYVAVTVLLWPICFLNLFSVYGIMAWLPTLLQNKGLLLTTALHASAVFTASGVIGGVALSSIIPKYGPPRVLGGACVLGVLAVSGLAMSADAMACLVWAALAGAAISGAQFGTVVLLAGIYHPSIRSTGISWALGVGRAGGILAPTLGGMALDGGLVANQILQALALPLTMNILLLFLLSRAQMPDRVAVQN